MQRLFRNITVTIGSVALAMTLAGCSTTASLENGDDLAKSVNGSETVIFGKLRLVRNGANVDLSDGMFATTATLQLDNASRDHSIVGKVGKDGEFAWALYPGEYRVTSIGHDNRGQHVKTDTGLVLTVPAGEDAVYVGTITVEASFEYGMHVPRGEVEQFRINNDCATDCAARLESLGMSGDDMTVSLVTEQYQLARTN